MPSLKTLSEKEKRRKDKLAESTQGLGFSQIFEFGERSNLEYVKIIYRIFQILTFYLDGSE